MLCSEVCLVPKGDTPTSSRFYSAIACGCVPLVLSDDLGYHLPFLRRVNYTFVQHMREKEFLDDPRAAVGALMARLRPQLPALRQLMHQEAAELLFEEEGSRVAENMLHEYALGCHLFGSIHHSYDARSWAHVNRTLQVQQVAPPAPAAARPPRAPAPPPWWLAGLTQKRVLAQ